MADCLRRPNHRYHDPLALIWLRCAERIGFRVRRTPEVYASADGRGTISIGTDEILDPDDSLAQMIFHELCHALVEGEAGWRQPDWGLGNAVGRIPGASTLACGSRPIWPIRWVCAGFSRRPPIFG